MNCDRIARWYRWLEYGAFGRALERRRFALLDDVLGVKRVLMLGEGDGRFLQAFLGANRDAVVDYVDSSAVMLSLARHRAGVDAHRVTFHHADALEWEPMNGGYDLVTAHFFFDCFHAADLERLIGKIPARGWMVSEFHQPAGGLASVRAAFWIRSLYLLFGVATGLKTRALADYGTVLRRHGFQPEKVITANAGLLVSELWRQR